MIWDEDNVALLRRLWAEGYSAGEIARRFGAGCSRNSVIGKAHRMGLSARTKPTLAALEKRVQKKVRRLARKAAGAAEPHYVQETLEPLRLEDGTTASVLTLGLFMCRFPIGDPETPGFSFCGRSTEFPGPYCRFHARVAYRGGPRNGDDSH
ncbi:MAG: GcrA family cell cycle regulator [Hyphomonadaceae bacterium]